jgi:excisionase family DNA binding protein
MSTPLQQPTKKAYSVREACHVTSLGRTTLFGHMASGRLQSIKIGGRRIILAENLHAFLRGET